MCFELLSFEMSDVTQLTFEKNNFKSVESCDLYHNSIARNHVKLGVFSKGTVLSCVVDDGYGLGRSLGDCRPALPKGQKYQMVKTQTESHDRRPIV